MSTPLSNEQQKQRPECGPCGSGDRCLQPWAMLNPEYKCNRCNKVLHQICASIDATKAPEGQFEDPNSIRVCYLCLLPSESPNHLGTTAATENAGLSPPAKKARTDSEGATSFLSPGNVKWDELTKPHESIIGLVNQNKAVAPEASKKTIWWRCFYTWNMKEFGDEVPQPLAYCNLCGKSVKMSKVDRSPTPLKRHLQIHHKELYQTLYQQKLKDGPVISPPAQKRPKNSSTPKDKTTAKMGKKEFIRNKQLQAIVEWIVDTDQPLDVVESESFRNMTATMIFNLRHQNKFSKSAIEEHISSQIRGMRDIIRGLLFNCSIVHVQEYWKTSGGHSYQVDRAFWIDNDFKLRYVALACELAASVPKRDIEESLWKPIGVDSVKQVAVTVGNNASNWLAGSSVSPMFHGLEYDLQQIAKTAYQALGPDVEQILQKVRAIVQKVESSSVVREALEKAQADLKSLYSSDQETVNLILDAVEDSWWSTQEMITRLLYLRKALEYIMLDARLQDEIDILTRREWELLEHLQMVWEPLNIAPELLQKQKFVTISLVPIVLQIIGEDLASFQGQNCSEPQVSQCLTQMAKVWDDRYGEQFPSKPFQGLDTTIWLAHVLDPRFKALHVFKGSSTSDEVIFSKLLEKMVGIRFQDESQGGGADVNDAEKSEDSPQKKKSTASSSTSMGFRMFASSRPSLSGGNKRGLQRLSERFSINSKTKEHDVGADDTEREKIKEECQTELDDYKSVQGMEMWIELEDGTKDFEDPLTWWQTHQERFPTLWKLARMYLAIPATCAPSERAFDPEAHSILAKRCQTQTSNSSGVRLFKENAGILSKEAGAKEPEEETEEAVQIVPV